MCTQHSTEQWWAVTSDCGARCELPQSYLYTQCWEKTPAPGACPRLFTESPSDVVQKGAWEVSGPPPTQSRVRLKLDPAAQFQHNIEGHIQLCFKHLWAPLDHFHGGFFFSLIANWDFHSYSQSPLCLSISLWTSKENLDQSPIRWLKTAVKSLLRHLSLGLKTLISLSLSL